MSKKFNIQDHEILAYQVQKQKSLHDKADNEHKERT